MKYVSVCAGIEAATVAWHPLGWEPVLFSEIEPFPCAVLKHHYPDVPLVGDFTQLIQHPPKADLLVGGTPCQAFSVAGKRLSLEDYRGNLSLAFADLFHAGQYRWAVWENVPGVLSTKDNAFGCLLGRLVGADAPLHPARGGRWTNAGVVSGPLATAAWRVLDAQYFGVAQRRRRVFVLVSRGAGNWAAAAALLPVGERVSRHPPTRRQAGEGTAETAARSLALRGRDGGATAELGDEIGNALRASMGGGDKAHVLAPSGERPVSGTLTARMLQSLGARDVEEGAVVVGALDTECGFGKATDQTVRNGQNMAVPHAVAPPLTATNDPSRSPQSSEVTAQVEAILLAQGAVPQVLRNREGKDGGGKGPLLSEDQSLTLGTANDQVVFALDAHNGTLASVHHTLGMNAGGNGAGASASLAPAFPLDLRNAGRDPEKHDAMNRQGTGTGEDGDPAPTVSSAFVHGVVSFTQEITPKHSDGAVPSMTSGGQRRVSVTHGALRPRRLTPTECSRLQGFPDRYLLDVLWRGKSPPPDGPMYKALGNSFAVPVVYWIGRRIAMVESSNGEVNGKVE